MRLTKDIDLNYVTDNGEDKKYTFKIKFVSNRIIRDFTELQKQIGAVQRAWNEVKTLLNEISKDKLTKKARDKKQKEIEAINDKIKVLSGEDDFFTKRLELIKSVLIKNGYNDAKKEYLTFKFYDENVEPKESIYFLTQCIFKDDDGKK